MGRIRGDARTRRSVTEVESDLGHTEIITPGKTTAKKPAMLVAHRDWERSVRNEWKPDAGLVKKYLLDLQSPNRDARSVAAGFLGLTGQKSMIPRLLPLLEDPDPFVALNAAGSLARLGDKKGWDFLRSTLSGRQHDDYRLRAVEILGGVGGREAALALNAALTSEKSYTLRARLVESIGRSVAQGDIARSRTLKTLRGIEMDPEEFPDVRAAAIRAIHLNFQSGDASDVDSLFSIVNEEPPRSCDREGVILSIRSQATCAMREAAIEALGHFKNEKSFGLLLLILTDNQALPEDRVAALHELKEFGRSKTFRGRVLDTVEKLPRASTPPVVLGEGGKVYEFLLSYQP